VRRDVSKKEAIEYFTKKGDEYKLELIDGLADGSITFYQQGNFVDLCRGPHIPTTGPIKAIKLLSVAGAYWRGDEKNKMLKRIYGITFPKQKELEEYLHVLEEAKETRSSQARERIGVVCLLRESRAGLTVVVTERNNSARTA
jgi:threonyl-tRNA synthetase